MPAVSKVQRRFFGLALCYKEGRCKDVSDKVKKVANSMTLKQLKDYASTSEKDLPEKIKEDEILTYSEYLEILNEFDELKLDF